MLYGWWTFFFAGIGLLMLIMGRIPIQIFPRMGEIEGIWVRIAGIGFLAGLFARLVINYKNSLVLTALCYGTGLAALIVAAVISAARTR